MAAGENIRVIGRFRPLSEREQALERERMHAPPRFSEDGRSVTLGPDESACSSSLDAVLPPSASQADLYQQVRFQEGQRSTRPLALCRS